MFPGISEAPSYGLSRPVTKSNVAQGGDAPRGALMGRRSAWMRRAPDPPRYNALTAAVSAASPSFASAKSIPVFSFV